MKQWRSGANRSVYARRIERKDYPKLLEAMRDDGLIAIITDSGLRWHVGGYTLTRRSVEEAWNITPAQMNRITTYIYEEGWKTWQRPQVEE